MKPGQQTILGVPVPQGRFFGPCSGQDLPLAFLLFGNTVDRFTFCDLSYRGQRITAKTAVPRSWTLISRVQAHDEMAVEKIAVYSGNRTFRPRVTFEIWRRSDASEVLVELRCDLAQDVLIDQFAAGSIAAFMHINDGSGEGGSDLWFLSRPSETRGDSHRQNELLPETLSRLCDGCIVVTDGVLAAPEFRSDAVFELEGRRWERMSLFSNDRRADRPIGIWRCLVK